MKKYVSRPLLVFASAVCLWSCSKDKDDTPTKQLTPEELLTAHKWQLTASKGEVPVLGSVDLFPSMNSCQKDDFEEFKLSGELVFDQGATKCFSTSPQSKTGSWTLSENKKKMTIKEPGESDKVADVLELTATTLKIQYMGITTYPTTNTYSRM